MNIDSPVSEMNAAHLALRMDRKVLSEQLKIGVVLATFATAILSSAFLAYSNTVRWTKITATVSLIALYALPKILRHGNAEMVHYALSINLTVLSSLFLGGIGAATLALSHTFIASLKTYQMSTALFCSFGITALIGYGIPLFRDGMVRAYQFLNDPDTWKDNICKLQEQFSRMPEMGLGCLQTNLWPNTVLQLTLIQPNHVLSWLHFLFITPRDYVWSLAAAASNTVTLQQFQEILSTFEEIADLAESQNEDLPIEMQENYRNRLTMAIKGLKKEDLEKAIPILLESGSKFVPRVIANKEFLELFASDVLAATKAPIQEFLDATTHWPEMIKKYRTLETEILKIEQEIAQFEKDFQNKSSQNVEELSEKHHGVNTEFYHLRGEVEHVYSTTRAWQKFAGLWNSAQTLPFDHSDDLLQVLHDKSLMDEIKTVYLSLIGTNKRKKTLSERMQIINNKMIVLNRDEKEEEAVSTIIFLAANHGFIQEDFEKLQEWLNLDSLNNLEEALTSIGLETENDLYFNEILEPQLHISKNEILLHLCDFIKSAAQQKKLSGLIEPLEDRDSKKRVYALGETVSRVIYHLTVSGLILVPILIRPQAGLAGFSAGSLVFILKRFGIQKAVDFVNLSNHIIESIPFGSFIRSIFRRRVFSITPNRREGANAFASADFFGRMRLINENMISSMVISYATLRIDQPFLGSFLQGIAFADEIVNLV